MPEEKDVEMKVVTVEDEEERQNGLLCDVNNIDRMIELGSLAFSNSEALSKLLELPSFLMHPQEPNKNQFNHVY